MPRTRSIAVWSLLFTALFFIEYTPALPRMRIPYDLEGFHYPLADYAFQALKQGRFPQWDPSTYSGLSFVGNSQTAIFYPPMWLLFALKWGSAKLSYRALEYLELAHVWLAFILCYAWLHDRRKLHWLASILGAGGYAFGGYVMNNLQHLGLMVGYAWLPLAFVGVDEAEQKRDWRPLWKLALASAMCLLGGYPPMWIVFALCAAAYAVARRGGVRMGLWVSAALACSLLFAAVALLPATEAAGFKVPEVKYGWTSGFTDLAYYISYFVPNYFRFDMGVDAPTNAIRDYLYLGAVILAGLPWLFPRKKFRDVAPLLAVLLVSLLFLVNPGRLLGRAIENTFLGQVTIDWDFLAGVSAALAPMAALGLDFAFRRTGARALSRGAGAVIGWSAAAGIALAVAWSVRLIVLWNGPAMASGAKSAWDALGGIVLCSTLIYLFARTGGGLRSAVAAALILLAAAEYKAFGTSKRFDASSQSNFISHIGATFPGMSPATYADLLRHREYRWAMAEFGPSPVDLRHRGVTTPQGFDPNLPAQYKKLIDQIGHFRTNRMFDLDLDNPAALRLLGVGYVIGSEQSPGYARLLEDPNLRLMQPADSYYKVFELVDAQPPFGWEQPTVRVDADRSADVTAWQPEKRGFRVRSPTGGVFRLSEQFLPGWTARLDGAPVEIERCHEAFQCVAVPAGEHLLEFRYRSRWLLPGAVLSLCSILLALVLVRFRAHANAPAEAPSDPAPPEPALPASVVSHIPLAHAVVKRQALTRATRIVAALLLAAFFWAFHARVLKSHLELDDMMNLYGYWNPPLWKVFLSNLTFWTTFVRPMAAVYYLPLFHLFKLNPVPYSWVRIAMLAVNTVLFYKLALRLSRSWWVAALAAFPIAYQANLGNLAYNSAFIFDTLCAGFYFAALLYYVDRRESRTHLSAGQACVFLALYICALDSKEMAVSLPVVALAYELLLRERKGCGAHQQTDTGWFGAALRFARIPEKRASGLANLARQLWPSVAAGAITAVYILGKTLGAGSLTSMDAYRPVLTWARFSESSTRFFNTIFYTDGMTMEHACTLWGLLLCAGIVRLARRPRDPRWLFLWIWVMVTPLPIVFLPGRGDGLLYLVAAGWAIAAAMLCRSLAWRLTRELFAGRPARLAAMGLLWLGCAAAYTRQTLIVHRERVDEYLRAGKTMTEAIGQFKKLSFHPPPGSRIVFLHDPFPNSFGMVFVASLVWNDHSLKIFQQSQHHLTEDQIAGMDSIIDYTGGEFVVLKPATVVR